MELLVSRFRGAPLTRFQALLLRAALLLAMALLALVILRLVLPVVGGAVGAVAMLGPLH